MNFFKDNSRTAIIKRLLILLVAILIVFASINAVWYLGYQQKYNAIASKLNATYIDDIEEADRLRYTKEIGDYTITMKMPSYLGSGGFVSVGKTDGYITVTDDEGNIVDSSDMCITLFIWPKYFSDYKIGLDFYDEVNSIMEQVEFTSSLEMMHTDTLDDEFVEYINQLVAEYEDEIMYLIHLAEETLEIDIVQN